MTDEPIPCPACDDTGWIQSQSKPGSVRKCPECIDRRRGFTPGVPEDERGSTMENYEANGFNGTAVKHAALFVAGVHQGLYLHGPVGTGKTRLACSILNDMRRLGNRVRFVRVPELLVRLQPHVTTGDEADALIADLANTPILVLDDIGANAGTDFSRRMIQILIDARTDRGNRTIWTSNLTLDDLGAFLSDERLPSRIVGACRVVELLGPDQRTIRKPRTPKAGKKDPVQRKLGGSRW